MELKLEMITIMPNRNCITLSETAAGCRKCKLQELRSQSRSYMGAFFELQRNIYNKRMDAAKELETYRLLSTQESSFVGRSASQRDPNVYAVMSGKQTPMVESNDPSIADTGDNHADIQTLQPNDTFSSGLLLVWGCGEFGQHGHGHKRDVHRADALGSPLWFGQDRMVLKVACGSSHTLALTGY